MTIETVSSAHAGYDGSQVDEHLAEPAVTLAALQQQLREQQRRLAELEVENAALKKAQFVAELPLARYATSSQHPPYAEEALRHELSLVATLIENLPDCIYFKDLSSRFLSVNPALARQLGVSDPVEVVGKTDAHYFCADHAAKALADEQVIIRTGQPLVDHEENITWPDGRETWMLMTKLPLRNQQGQIIGTCGISSDITARKQAEEALRQNEALLRSITENSRDIIFVKDRECRFVYMNPACCRLNGLAPAQAIGRTKADFYPDALEGERFNIDDLRVIASGQVETIEEELLAADGTRHVFLTTKMPHLDGQGNVIGLIGMGRDITWRHRRAEALRQSEERYRLLFSELMNGCALHSIVCDEEGKAVDYITLEVNQAFERLLGVSRDAVIGKRASELLPPDELHHWLDIFAPVAQQGTSTQYTVHSPINDKHFEGVAYCPASGQFAVVFADITARKQAEEERDKLQAQLAQAQKMESVGRLAGGVAHDFNNMLVVILGNAELAQMQLSPTEPLYADLNEIIKAANRSADLTRQLLTFARKQTVAPQVLDLNETIAGMSKMLRRLIGEAIDLTWVPARHLWRVKIDPSQIHQMLANLCVNARDAIDGVGKITIETQNTFLDATSCVEHAEAHAGEYVLMVVRDTGCGMAAETREHLFEPFFTTKDIGQGTGLGLATVYGVVQQNHGFIDVVSELGQGTTFKIYLPRHIDPADLLSQDDLLATIPRGQETVLLVEDELAILQMGKRMLEQHGYRVLTAGTPGEAIRVAALHAGDIHLLLTDVVMPEMNGRDLSIRLLAGNPSLKCLFMSGYTANVIAHQGVLDKGVSFVQKPFTIQSLAAKVREV